MFLLDNAIIILMVGGIVFFLFTFLIISTFGQDFMTSLFLTSMFFVTLFKLPLQMVNDIYKDRNKILHLLKKDHEISDKHLEMFKHILNSRFRIFRLFLRAGMFSYTASMIGLAEWYKSQPFTVQLSTLKQKRKKKKSFEKKYRNTTVKGLKECIL
ncbi:hypothetical protein [Bacillus pumilus]|uniref:hypothetical protein n=1 Tax=Bacillus pumilus TaxID=1408 RepID=UPI0011A5BCEF|nr:hypothetical protein [Bacillus pumilus]